MWKFTCDWICQNPASMHRVTFGGMAILSNNFFHSFLVHYALNKWNLQQALVNKKMSWNSFNCTAHSLYLVIFLPHFPFIYKETYSNINTMHLLILYWIPNKMKLVPSMTFLQLFDELNNQVFQHHMNCNNLRWYAEQITTSFINLELILL